MHGAIIIVVVSAIHSRDLPNSMGKTDDLWVFGLIIFNTIMMVCVMKFCLSTGCYHYYLILSN